MRNLSSSLRPEIFSKVGGHTFIKESQSKSILRKPPIIIGWKTVWNVELQAFILCDVASPD
jgi:hypothetical protein